ncbi:hypothetical protein PCASD_03275 [Puccinia coronata f. sp. avenae]|uniref:Uncharacterized protein n=1 Tax=Puccinia coronata f. sp. avenae TaxID=200324 RepID=A0A2N5VE51_9BASI|nr:hypothetical protein PCASD_03275 [Puccinia coronata f. sp. avenae]
MRSVSQGSGRFHNTRGYQPFWKPIDAKRTAPVVYSSSLTQSRRFGGPGEPRRAGGPSRSEPPPPSEASQGEGRFAP